MFNYQVPIRVSPLYYYLYLFDLSKTHDPLPVCTEIYSVILYDSSPPKPIKKMPLDNVGLTYDHKTSHLTAPCLWTPPGSSKNEIRSLAPLLCSRFRWPWKSSVTWLGSPPGKDAHIGQTTSWLASLWRLDTCSYRSQNRLKTFAHRSQVLRILTCNVVSV